MKTLLQFSKYSGNGNDFIILDRPGFTLSTELVIRLCDRHFGVGADGVLLVSEAPNADARMQIFNADGGEAEMCGNGIRCLVTYLHDKAENKKSTYRVQTMNAVYEVTQREGAFAIEMSEIKDQNLFDLSQFQEFEKSFFINTGVPHLVFMAKDIHSLDIKATARKYRYHSMFPNGTNVSFLEITSDKSAFVRTYERGVEDETYSCGTGLTACALALQYWKGWKGTIMLKTKGGTQRVEIEDKVFYSGEVVFCFSGEIVL